MGEHGGELIKLYLGNSIDMSLDNSPVGGGEGGERGKSALMWMQSQTFITCWYGSYFNPL